MTRKNPILKEREDLVAMMNAMTMSKTEEGNNSSVGYLTSVNEAVIRVCAIGKENHGDRDRETEHHSTQRAQPSSTTASTRPRYANPLAPGRSVDDPSIGNPWENATVKSSRHTHQDDDNKSEGRRTDEIEHKEDNQPFRREPERGRRGVRRG